jgi:hypothetical protein
MKYLFVALLILSGRSGTAQVAVDQFTRHIMPYDLDVPDSCIVRLPDSLGGNKYSGYAFADVSIDSSGKIVYVKLTGLHLVRKSSSSLMLDMGSQDTGFSAFSAFQNYIADYILKLPIKRVKPSIGEILDDNAVGSGLVRIYFE